MSQLTYLLPLILAVFSCLPNVTGFPALKRNGPRFQGMVVFGNSYSDNGVSLPALLHFLRCPHFEQEMISA
jgi:phospholipase/lecithinase/hemolysin